MKEQDASAGGGVDVDQRRACESCGYALVGLATDGACPRCGIAIERSQGGRLLHEADIGYVQALARGGGMVMWGTLGLGVFGAGYLLVLLSASATHSAPSARRNAALTFENWIDVVYPLMAMVALVVSALGWGKLSGVDPGSSQSHREAVNRWCTGWLYVVGGALFVVIVLLRRTNASLFEAWAPWFWPCAWGLLALVILLWLQAAMRLVRALADRVSDRTLRARARRCATWAWAVAAWQFGVAAGFVAMPSVAKGTTAIAVAALGLLVAISFVAAAFGVVLFILYAMMVVRLRGALVRARTACEGRTCA